MIFRIIFVMLTALTIAAPATSASDDTTLSFDRLHDEAQAQKLFRQGKYAEAQAAYEALAESAPDAVEKSQWQARAALAVGRQADQWDQAMALAERIEHEPYAVRTQMELLAQKGQHEQIVARFKDEQIVEWPAHEIPKTARLPAGDVRVLALWMRGRAYYRTGDGEAAERDLSKAVELMGDKLMRGGDILITWARNRQQLLKDDEKAFEAYSQLLSHGRRGINGAADYYRALLNTASYHRKWGEYDKALELIRRVKPRQQTNAWHGNGLIALGRTFAAAGRTEEAIDAYEAVITVEEGKPDVPRHRRQATLELAELLAEQGQRDDAIQRCEKLLEDDSLSAQHRERVEQKLNELRASGQ